MGIWETWQPQRFFYLFIGVAFLLVWVQVVLFHWRGAFRRIPMWAPVLFSPLLAIMGIVFAFFYGGIINWFFVIIFGIGALEGLIGTYLHFDGVRRSIGGFTLRNFMAGPPVILPVVFMALAAAALVLFFIWPGPAGGLDADLH